MKRIGLDHQAAELLNRLSRQFLEHVDAGCESCCDDILAEIDSHGNRQTGLGTLSERAAKLRQLKRQVKGNGCLL